MIRHLGLFVLYKNELHRHMVVETNEEQVVQRVFRLNDHPFESAHTSMHNGIITGEWKGYPPMYPDVSGQEKIIHFLTEHTQPIIAGETNRLIVWERLDFIHWQLKQPEHAFRYL